MWPYTNDRRSSPQAYQCLLAHFLASLGAQEKTDCTSMLWSIDCCQNRVSADQYHLTLSRAQVSTHRGRVYLKLPADMLLVFKWSQAQVCFLKICIKYVVFMSLWPSTIEILIANLPRTRKFSHLFKNTSGEDLFLPWSRVGHVLRPIFMLWLVKICQAKNLWSILKLVYCDNWSWQSFVSTCDVF